LEEDLIYACRLNCSLLEVEEFLLKGAKPSYDNDIMFIMAIQSGDYEFLDLLIKYDTLNRVKENKAFLFNAVIFQQYDCMRLLLKRGANKDDQSLFSDILDEVYADMIEEDSFDDITQLEDTLEENLKGGTNQIFDNSMKNYRFGETAFKNKLGLKNI
jgi:hypothetical protein